MLLQFQVIWQHIKNVCHGNKDAALNLESFYQLSCKFNQSFHQSNAFVLSSGGGILYLHIIYKAVFTWKASKQVCADWKN